MSEEDPFRERDGELKPTTVKLDGPNVKCTLAHAAARGCRQSARGGDSQAPEGSTSRRRPRPWSARRLGAEGADS